jgi:hypothetical protein
MRVRITFSNGERFIFEGINYCSYEETNVILHINAFETKIKYYDEDLHECIPINNDEFRGDIKRVDGFLSYVFKSERVQRIDIKEYPFFEELTLY